MNIAHSVYTIVFEWVWYWTYGCSWCTLTEVRMRADRFLLTWFILVQKTQLTIIKRKVLKCFKFVYIFSAEHCFPRMRYSTSDVNKKESHAFFVWKISYRLTCSIYRKCIEECTERHHTFPEAIHIKYIFRQLIYSDIGVNFTLIEFCALTHSFQYFIDWFMAICDFIALNISQYLNKIVHNPRYITF